MLTTLQKILILYLVVILLYWTILFVFGLKDSLWNYLFSFCFSLMPLVGGLYGIFQSKEWGGVRSVIGKAVFFVSIGLVMWGFGSMIFAYYNIVLNDPAPYPSLADLSYILCWPLWSVGMINLAKATGARFSLRNLKGKILIFSVPLILILFSYYLLIVVARGGAFSDFSGVVKIAVDLAYPIGDVIILTLAILIYGLSFDYLGGKFKFTIIALLFGFVLNYIADFIFSYTTTVGSFYVGNYGDLIFALAMFFLTFGVLGISKSVLLKDGI